MILENSGEHKTLVIVLGHKHQTFMEKNSYSSQEQKTDGDEDA